MTKTNEQQKDIPVKNKEIPFLASITIIAYVISVLIIDTFITFDVHFILSWGKFSISLFDILNKVPVIKYYSYILIFQNFDATKFFLWLIFPFVLFYKFINFGWFSFRSWRKSDYILLSVFIVICLLSLVFVLVSPMLRMYYPGLRGIPFNQKMFFAIQQVLWVISWLPGWEFMNRHLLLRSCQQLSKNYVWLLVPVVETLYHIYKAMLEMTGMFIFSFFACWWSMKRENNIMAFLCHFAVEIGLIVLLLIT